jgi:hypothetical protein
MIVGDVGEHVRRQRPVLGGTPDQLACAGCSSLVDTFDETPELLLVDDGPDHRFRSVGIANPQLRHAFREAFGEGLDGSTVDAALFPGRVVRKDSSFDQVRQRHRLIEHTVNCLPLERGLQPGASGFADQPRKDLVMSLFHDGDSAAHHRRSLGWEHRRPAALRFLGCRVRLVHVLGGCLWNFDQGFTAPWIQVAIRALTSSRPPSSSDR